MTTTTPDAKADRNGSYYVSVCPRGFKNEVTFYRVKSQHVAEAQAEIDRFNERHGEPGDHGNAEWIDAGKGGSCDTGRAIEYDPSAFDIA